MELIQSKVSDALKQALQELNNTYFSSYFNSSTNNLINHRVFYCNKWSEEENKKGLLILELLKKECDHLKDSFTNHTLIQLNIINAPPDCNTQLFHIDYQGDSASYFIPLVDLSDLNGTEYVYFFNEEHFIKYYHTLLQMSDNYLDKTEIIEYLSSKHGLIVDVDFTFKCANSNPYALLYMPYYVYHRGQKNKTNTNRLMLNILFSIGDKFSYPIEEYILDSEIDEKDRYAIILDIRKNKTIT
jgi:hypothetical protein